MSSKYLKIVYLYFRRVLELLILCILFLGVILYSIVRNDYLGIFYSLLLLTCLHPLWFDVRLVVFFFNVKKELHQSPPLSKTIRVNRLKSNRLHNYYGYTDSASGIERYVLYDDYGEKYFLCSKNGKNAVTNLCLLDDAVLKIEYLPHSGFLLSLRLLKKKNETLNPKKARIHLNKEVIKSFEQYIPQKSPSNFQPNSN